MLEPEKGSCAGKGEVRRESPLIEKGKRFWKVSRYKPKTNTEKPTRESAISKRD